MWSVTSTVLALVLFATYLGIGALAHSTHFSLGWALASTVFVWAGPAQIILISTLGSGATVVQAAIAVTVSAIRLFPMVVSVLPMLRTPTTKRRHLVLAAHFIAVTLWVECFRLLPQVPREAHRLHARAGQRSGLALPRCHHGRLRSRRQTPGAVRRGDPVVDAVGIPALDRAQLPAACRRSGAGAGVGAVSTYGDVAHRG
jgi:hypothetical protein